jgi:flap endonuclease-1
MRATAAVSGIKGIFPLIKKHAPHCITPLVGLDALPKSTRLAIDATLLIQRLHFADDVHPSRHIIGFHRLIRQMRECSLVPIMVFDNFSQGARLPAKMRENEKRREKRHLLTMRANMERLRGQRLEALAGAMKEWNELRSDDRIKSAELLQSWNLEEEQRRRLDLDDAYFRYDEFDEDLTSELQRISDTVVDANIAVKGDFVPPDEDGGEFLLDALSREDMLSGIPSIPPPADNLWSSVQEAESSKVLYMASKIHRLRRQYGAVLNIDQGPSLGEVSTKTPSAIPETPSQATLTLAEGSVYRRLQSGTMDPVADINSLVGSSQAEAASMNVEQRVSEEEEVKEEEDQPDDLLALTTKNVLLQRSYSRSSAPLSSKIFASCARLCELLKVPVLWTGDGSRSGGRRHEAEALASVLVRNNLADVVVSEDSDVLLYQVPLLRGVMGHKGLEYIDSVNVRRSLFPPSLISSDPDNAEKESLKQMLDFALLCGTDFNRTVPGIGPHTALKLIQDYKTIDGIRKESVRRRAVRQAEASAQKSDKKIKKDDLFSVPDHMRWREYSKELNEARRVFENPPSIYWEAHKLTQRKMEEEIDYAALTEFLHSHNIAPKETNHLSTKRERLLLSTDNAFGGNPFSDGRSSASSWPASAH